MPASMIRAPTGGSPKVLGSSMAMVATEPTPGSTPINVPTSAPMRQNTRFHGVAATEKPSARLARRSCMTDSLGSEPRPQLEREIQQVDEQQHGKRRHDDAGNDGFDPPGLVFATFASFVVSGLGSETTNDAKVAKTRPA